MAIAVELDFRVDLEFFYLGKWPNALMDAIAEKKEEIYKSLAPNPLEPDMLMAERTFRLDGHDYRVTFGIDRKRASKSVFRVIYVEFVAPSRKR